MNKKDKAYNPEWAKYVNLWKGIGPPWRPNKNQLSFYRAHLKKQAKKNPKLKVLILGATPETRDICAKLKLQVTCLDSNQSMYQGMKEFMSEDPRQESFVRGKWEKVGEYFKENEFDIIFSDETQCNMALTVWKKNFQDIFKVLKKDGLYFCAMVCMDFQEKITFDLAFKKYKENPKFFLNFQNKVYIFYQLCLEYVYSWEKRGCVLHDLRKKIINYTQKHKISKEILAQIWPFHGDFKGNVLGEYIEVDPPLGEVYEYLIPHFYIEDVYLDRSHPVYRFRRDLVLKPII